MLEKADKPSLIKVTLEAMLRFLNWIPLGYIFETPVIDHLITRVRACSFSAGAASSKRLKLEPPPAQGDRRRLTRACPPPSPRACSSSRCPSSAT